MKKLLLLLLLPLCAFSQKLKCEDFKTGNFIMTNVQFPGVEIAIFRDEKAQTETKIADKENITEGFSDKTYEKIEWLNDCEYKLMFDFSKMKSSEFTELINNSGGIVTRIISIEGNCYFYEASLTIDGQTQKMTGTICKDESN